VTKAVWRHRVRFCHCPGKREFGIVSSTSDELEKLAKEVGSMKTKEPITPTTLVKNDLFLNVRRK